MELRVPKDLEACLVSFSLYSQGIYIFVELKCF